eukprot:Clim_evm46s150 gene=Clim_evmTU46s150
MGTRNRTYSRQSSLSDGIDPLEHIADDLQLSTLEKPRDSLDGVNLSPVRQEVWQVLQERHKTVYNEVVTLEKSLKAVRSQMIKLVRAGEDATHIPPRIRTLILGDMKEYMDLAEKHVDKRQAEVQEMLNRKQALKWAQDVVKEDVGIVGFEDRWNALERAIKIARKQRDRSLYLLEYAQNLRNKFDIYDPSLSKSLSDSQESQISQENSDTQLSSKDEKGSSSGGLFSWLRGKQDEPQECSLSMQRLIENHEALWEMYQTLKAREQLLFCRLSAAHVDFLHLAQSASEKELVIYRDPENYPELMHLIDAYSRFIMQARATETAAVVRKALQMQEECNTEIMDEMAEQLLEDAEICRSHASLARTLECGSPLFEKHLLDIAHAYLSILRRTQLWQDAEFVKARDGAAEAQ